MGDLTGCQDRDEVLAQAGFATALVTGHGSLLGLEVAAAIQSSGIAPDHIVTEI